VCINEALIRKKECPNCRKDIRKYNMQTTCMIDSAVSQLMRNKKDSDVDEFNRHNERIESYKKWK
jgi:hypothetical protein